MSDHSPLASSSAAAAHDVDVDVVVIGAGPAGCVAALVLADAGRSVLLLERRALPRYHIGESQLTYAAETFRQLGLYDEIMAQGYPVKSGAEFIFPNGGYNRTNFADQGPGRQPTTVQVERAHFDNLLAQSARKRGATLKEPAVVQELLRDDTGRVVGVRYDDADGSHVVRARWVIDAGGRASQAAQTFRTRKDIPWLRNIAVYRYYTGLDERYNPAEKGDIQVGGHADGWIWAIPIWSHTISIGAVMPKEALRAGGSPEAVFEEHLSRVPRIVQRLTGTTPGAQVRVESDYCYYSDTVFGPGWLMAGDAAHFIDPIFSGGTCLAAVSGREAARTVDRILDEPERTEEWLQAYANLYKTGYDCYTRLISAYYESGYKLGAYLKERGFTIDRDPSFARLLSGDFWGDTNPLAEHLRAQRRWDTFAPYERVRDCPVYPELVKAERAQLRRRSLLSA